MRQVGFAMACALAAALTAGCGGAQKRRGGGGLGFECDERRAAYQVTGSFKGPAYGVRLFCDGNVPMVEEIRTGDDGVEQKRGAAIDVDAWEKAWAAVEDTGWRMLEDCRSLDMDPKAPFWVFEIGDAEKSVSVTCKSTELPFPYDTLQHTLDDARGELPVQEGEE
jgi:hypothetical protein